MKIPKHWLHIGTNELTIQQFKKPHNHPFLSKPRGGIWASPFWLDDSYHSDWHEYMFGIWGKSRRLKGVVFSFKENTRFYVINSQQDLIELIDKVGKTQSPLPVTFNVGINFENAMNAYDVIYLTEQGQNETRMPFQNTEYNLYGWDVESCVVLNPHVIEEQMPLTIV